jgi:hypothetical protein
MIARVGGLELPSDIFGPLSRTGLARRRPGESASVPLGNSRHSERGSENGVEGEVIGRNRREGTWFELEVRSPQGDLRSPFEMIYGESVYVSEMGAEFGVLCR